MQRERLIVPARFQDQPIELEVRLEQTNDAPVWWGFSIWDLKAHQGPQLFRLYETLFGVGSGLEEKLRAGQDLFQPASDYSFTPEALEQIYERAVALDAMSAREVHLPEVPPPGPRLRLSAFAERR